MMPSLDCGKTATLWLTALCLIARPLRVAGASAPESVLLTNAAQVHGLKQAEAAQHLPVRLRGVFLGESEPGGEGFALMDDTSGIYLRGTPAVVAQFRPGDWVEADGITDPGEFAPFVIMRKLTKLGTKTVPEPRPVSYDEMAAGILDAQWVEISGVVRSEVPVPNRNKTTMEVVTGGGRLMVRLNSPQSDRSLVDARVRLRGVCYCLVNKKRQLVSPLLAVPAGVPVVVETPAPITPYDTPVRPVHTLMQFMPDGSYGHRVHVRGLVTCQQPDEVWIKDGELGLRVQTRQKETLSPGDEVDVLGFPRHGEYAPLLEDAEFRVRAKQSPPAPEELAKAEDAFDHDADLVKLEAIVLERQQVLNGWTFEFQDDHGTVFKASLRQTNHQSAPGNSQPRSRVKVAGLCSVNRESTGPHSGLVVPRSFQLLLRSPADLSLVKPAPWWTLQHAIWLLGALAFGLVFAITGVMLGARRRLLKQATQRRMAEAEFTAILAERNRLAREIHDTLAQGLGAISLHLGLVRNLLGTEVAEGVKKHLDLAQNVTRASLSDARSAIFNMRSQVLEQGPLTAALENILRQMTDGTGVIARFEVAGQPRRLPPVTENAFLRIGQEAITNAEKHGQASQIEVRLDYAEQQVQLSVKDDGRGFDANRPPCGEGGFGLVGMRERAIQMQGELTICSRPSEGTEIVFTAPVPSETSAPS